MPGTLLKLLVEDKLLHSGKVPVNAKLRPLRREKRGTELHNYPLVSFQNVSLGMKPESFPVQKILHGEEPGYEAREAYHQNPCPISKCMVKLLPITVSFPGVGGGGLLSMQHSFLERSC